MVVVEGGGGGYARNIPKADLGEIGADVLFHDRDEHAQLLEQEVAQPQNILTN